MHQPIDQPESPYEQLRRAQNAVAIGTVAEVRASAPARCRVQVGDVLTDWIPWLTLRAGSEKKGAFWWPPETGEQVVVLSPGGDMRQAVALTSVFSDGMPEPEGASGDKMLMRWAETDYLEYAGGILSIHIMDAVLEITPDTIRARVPGATMELGKDGLKVTPEVQVHDIKLTTHKHLGVITGPMISGVPTP